MDPSVEASVPAGRVDVDAADTNGMRGRSGGGLDICVLHKGLDGRWERGYLMGSALLGLLQGGLVRGFQTRRRVTWSRRPP